VELENLIKSFAQLGVLMRILGSGDEWKGFETGVSRQEYDQINNLILRQKQFNGWFTEENVRSALSALGNSLEIEKLNDWLSAYAFTFNPKRLLIGSFIRQYSGM